MRPSKREKQSTTDTETELICQILDGHPERFRVLVDRYAASLLQMVNYIVPNKEDAEEVTQDSFLSAFESLSRYDTERASFKTWLMRIGYNTAMKQLRKKKISFIDMDDDQLYSIADSEVDTLLSEMKEERLMCLEKAVEQLSPNDQMILKLYYSDNLPLKEIGYVTDRTDTYLQSRLQWIRKKLARTIQTFENHDQR